MRRQPRLLFDRCPLCRRWYLVAINHLMWHCPHRAEPMFVRGRDWSVYKGPSDKPT